MHKLARQVRFSINPFLPENIIGDNSYSSKPAGQGLSLFFALWIELACEPDKDTGFVVNVTEIDAVVRKLIVPIYDETIKRFYNNKKHVSLDAISAMLDVTKIVLTEYFDQADITDLALQLNPERKFGIDTNNKDRKMFYYSEKFEFAAMHKLWNDKFTDKQNFNVFGKCANPTGHGHNYTAQITVSLDDDSVEGFCVADYQEKISKYFVDIVDHKNLNADVDFFKDKNPTVENIAKFAYSQLNKKFDDANLKEVTIWETDRTCCSYSEN